MRVIKNIILIFLIAAAVLFILNLFYQKGYRKYYSHETERISVLLDNRFYSDILFIGSSRTHVHNNPKVVDSITHLSSYNFGVEGGNIIEMNLWLQVYLQNHNKPKMVVLDLPAFAFDTYHKKFYNPTIYFPYLDNDIIFSTLLKYKQIGLYKYVPFLKFIEINDYDKSNAIKGLLGKHDKLSDSYTYRGFVENPIGKVPHDTTAYKISEEAKEYLNIFIDTCKKKNIQIVISYSPEYYDTDYRNMKSFFELVNEVSNKRQVPFWDYRNSELCRDSTLFANPGHLNKFGANLFSAVLAKDILIEMAK